MRHAKPCQLLPSQLISSLICFLMSAIPQFSSALDDELYYQLGGGEPIARPATNRDSTLELGAGIAWNNSLMCGNFDISLSVEQQLNGVKGAFQDLMGNVIDSASGAVASLPALVIQKVNPALYDLLQNGVLQANKEFHIAQTSCEEMVGYMESALEGNSWEAISKSGYWKEQSQSSSNEILEVKSAIGTSGLDHGVTWLGGQQRGGASQAPIEVISDTARAGYNLLLNRAPTNTTSTVSTCDDAAICELWVSPQDQADWIVDVLGEQIVRTCQGCDKIESKAGMGLSKKNEEEQAQIESNLIALVTATYPPTAVELAEVSGGPSLRMSRRVIEAIREERSEEQAAIINRLAGEMALNQTMERALIARRALLAGMKEPNIANVDIAQNKLMKAVDELNQEIDNMLFELEVRSKIASNTSAELLNRNRQRQTVPTVESQQPSTLKDGALH